MPALVAGIHANTVVKEFVDGRDKPGHDDGRGYNGRDTIRKCIMRGGFVYIMTNRPSGTLYTGVTSNLPQRAYQHREGLIDGFTKRYGLMRLVFYEHHETITGAIQREKNIKHWPRAWKVRLILAMNPKWDDLFDSLSP